MSAEDTHPAAWPLTPLQGGMLHHWLEDPHAGIDIEQFVIELESGAEPERWRTAWQATAAVCEALRLAFDWRSGEPVQFVREAAAVPWDEIRCDDDDAWRRWLDDDRRRGFAHDAEVLFRVTFVRTGEAARLVWTFHHLLLDGRSLTAVAAVAVHHHDRGCLPEVLPGAFTPWLAARSGTLTPEAEAFWKAQLEGIEGPTPVVVAVPPAAPVEFCQDETDLLLDEGTTTALHGAAAAAGVTMNTLVQAAWAVLIGRTAGEERVIFGATRACRHTGAAGEATAAGLLINTVPVTADVGPGVTLRQLLTALRGSWLAMRPHELAPLTAIRRAVGLPATQPLFHHLVVYEHADFDAALRAALPQPDGRRFALRELTSVPLTLQVTGGPRLRLHLAWQPQRFRRDTVERLLGHVAHLLGQLPAALDAPLRDLVVATPAEEHALIHEWQAPVPDIDSDITLHAWFAETARRFPERIAVSAPGTAWTYRELAARADAVAHCLKSRGAGRGDIVGLCMERRPELVAGLLGILQAGAAYLPIDLAYPAERLAFMLRDAGAKLLLTEHALSARLPEHAAEVVFAEDIPATEAPPPDLSGHDADQLAYVIYTSGSTGTPKGCLIPHRNVVRLMKATDPWYGFGPDDVWTLFHSTAFDFSVWELWGALLAGGRLVVVPWMITRAPDEFYRLLCREKVTVLNQTPSAFRQLMVAEPLARAADAELPPLALRYVIFGGEALEMATLRPWFERHGDAAPQLVNMYGITETTVHVTWRPLRLADTAAGSVIGIPIPDQRLFILDPVNRRPVPVGHPGEMHVGGAGLAVGYLNRPELTAERFIPDHLTGSGRLYRTGDLARFIPAASGTGLDVEYLGRIDQQVKIRGFRIELGEIESRLAEHPCVREAVVLAREERPGDRRLCAWLVATEPTAPEALRAHLARTLPDYMVPSAFVFMERLPITANGKLDRRALPAPAAPMRREAAAPPSTPVEAALADIWARVLRTAAPGVHDNFFECGGDSILGIQVIARAREAGLRLTPRQLFEHPTIAGLAAVAAAAAPAASEPAAGEDGDFALSPIQRWFLERELAGANHWNQTFLFTVSERLDADVLRRALAAVQRHHAALRLRFTRTDGAWRQHVHPEPDPAIVTIHDLGGLVNGRLEQAIEQACRVEQARLDFERGPLLRAAYIDCGEDRPGRLLLTIHHLAVDGVSWRILVEDLEAACRRLRDGQAPALPPATAPFRLWVERVASWQASPAAAAERPFWERMVTRAAAAPALAPDAGDGGSNTEGEAFTVRTEVPEAVTTALLHEVPGVFRTRINEVLAAALAASLTRLTGGRSAAFDMEGHGREEHIGGDADVSRTMGWFTTIYPVSLDLPAAADAGSILCAVKEQLRALPGAGAGCSALGIASGLTILFNYLGRFDAVTAGSELFGFAPESTGPWHSAAADRAYHVEINAMVRGGVLEVEWTAGRHLHRPETIERLAAGFADFLVNLAGQARTAAAPRFTPSDFPLAGLDQEAVDRLVRLPGRVADISRLSPMQELFLQAAQQKPDSGYDQWHVRIRGALRPDLLREAWMAVIRRHTVLRRSIQTAGLPHPVQVLHDGLDPEWRDLESGGRTADDAIAVLLAEDRARANDLARPPLTRFALLRLAADDWFFLWSVPDLLLDGWSWPVLFGEAGSLYRGLLRGESPQLPPARPYREYLAWRARQSEAAAGAFWREELSGLIAPTPVPVERAAGGAPSGRPAAVTARVEPALAAALQQLARNAGATPGCVAMAAWAVLLAQGADAGEVVVGSAFAGRPADLPGVERMVGPFVNNLPVRVAVPEDAALGDVIRGIHRKLAVLADWQHTAPDLVQEASSVPLRLRLFDSLVVFQNYAVGDDALLLGDGLDLTDFRGPVHTAYPLTLVVTPAAGAWQVELLAFPRACGEPHIRQLLDAVVAVLRAMAEGGVGTTVRALRAAAGIPRGSSMPATPPLVRTRPAVPPRTRDESRIAAVWQQVLGIAEIGVEDSFFDLGGHSLLAVRMLKRLQTAAGIRLTPAELFQFPTIAAIAARSGSTAATASPAAASGRLEAMRQRAVMARGGRGASRT